MRRTATRRRWPWTAGMILIGLLSSASGQAANAAAPPVGTVQVVADIDPSECLGPSSPLTLGPDGQLYGTMSAGGQFLNGCLYRVTPKAKGPGKLKVLHHFGGEAGAAGLPAGTLRITADGQILGTTVSGGQFGGGTLYRATLAGEVTVLKHFGDDPLGYVGPTGAPLLATDGRLYGSIWGGPGLFGGVYSVRPDGSDWKVLHAFGRGEDLWRPEGPLVQARDGALYGSTTAGPGERTAGGVFRLTLGGRYQVLHTMDAVGDGVTPRSGVIAGPDGALWGTNSICGGDGNWCSGVGTVFRISPGTRPQAAPVFEVIYTGGGLTAPAQPGELAAGLLARPDGSFWSTSYVGGTAGGYGTVYRLGADRQMSVMHSLGAPAGGLFPNLSLTASDDGWLYNVTSQGGAFGNGVVFRIREDAAPAPSGPGTPAPGPAAEASGRLSAPVPPASR